MRKLAVPLAIALFLIALVAVLVSTRRPSKPIDDKASTRASSSSEAPAFSVLAFPRPAPAASSSSAGPAAAGASLLTTIPWGSGPNALGRERPQEGNPEAPMSLAPTGDGRFVVLDQVNGRLAWLDKNGKFERTAPLSQRTPQDVVSAGEGKVAVLDRLGDKNVAIVDDKGNTLASLPLTSPGMPDPSGISGIFVNGKDVYAEYEHGKTVLLGSTDGTLLPDGTELPGRPGQDGKTVLSAGIISAVEGRLWVSAVNLSDQEHRFTRELRMPMPIGNIALLDTDKRGVIFLAAVLVDDTLGQTAGAQIVCLSPDSGAPVGGSFVSYTDTPEETFRSMAVLENGTVIMAVPTEQGMQYQVVGGC